MTDPAVDADAFNAFEAAGWDQRSAAYDDFFGPITSRVADPLLVAAGVRAGTRVLDVASGPGCVAGQPAEAQARARTAFDRLVREYETGAGLALPVSVKLAARRKPG